MVFPAVAQNFDTASNTTSERSRNNFLPTSAVAQFAGSIGLVSLGAGWDYGKDDKWATELLIGFVPKYNTDRNKITITLRQVYTPWSISLSHKSTYHPLRTGTYLSTTVGKQFWFSAPEKYPEKYYTFSTKLRMNIFIGQDFALKLNSKKLPLDRIRIYYDIHTSDLYLISGATNRYLKATDYLSVALGLKFNFK